LTPTTPGTLLLIGTDTRLAYLIERYLESSGLPLTVTALPPPGEVCGQPPAAALFLSVENLEASPALIADLQNCDVPLLVFSSVADKARARDLGADYCLEHPLTYQQFLSALDTALSARGS
jgi:hypothetical protein